MPINQRFLVVKNKDSKQITYMEYDKIDGYRVNPKNHVKFQDAINVKSMVLINPTLIEKMVDIKARKRFNNLINLLAVIYEDDDSSDDGLRLAKDEAEKFRQENKLAILEDELNLRMQYMINAKEEKEKEGKSR